MKGRFPMELSVDYFKRLSAIGTQVEKSFLSEWSSIKSLITQSQGDSALILDEDLEAVKDSYTTDDGILMIELYNKYLKDQMRTDKKATEKLNEVLEKKAETAKQISGIKNAKSIAKDFTNKVKDFSVEQVDSQIKSITGMNLATRPNVSDALDSVLRENVRLIKTIPSKYHNEVERVIREGVVKGQSLDTIEENVYKAGHKLTNNARLIARDQTGNAQFAVTKARFKEVGLKKFKWQTVGDTRVRTKHQKLNGRIFTWKDGANGIYPGTEIQCRCIALPVRDEVKRNFNMKNTVANR